MPIAAIVTRGFGTYSVVARVPDRGYLSGAVIDVPGCGIARELVASGVLDELTCRGVLVERAARGVATETSCEDCE